MPEAGRGQGKVACRAKSRAGQIHGQGKFTGRAKSRAGHTHGQGKVACRAKSRAGQSHGQGKVRPDLEPNYVRLQRKSCNLSPYYIIHVTSFKSNQNRTFCTVGRLQNVHRNQRLSRQRLLTPTPCCACGGVGGRVPAWSNACQDVSAHTQNKNTEMRCLSCYEQCVETATPRNVVHTANVSALQLHVQHCQTATVARAHASPRATRQQGRT